MDTTRYEKFRENALADPEVKTEYDALESEFDIIQAMIETGKEQNLTHNL